MRVLLNLTILFALLFLLSVPAAQAQDEAPEFTLYSSNPVVAHSSAQADWDGRYTDPGAVFYHDGQFHMFRNGFQGWPASVQIGYLTSPDGFTWTEASEDPVLLTDDVEFAGLAALASSALVEDDGTWVLYFYTWNGRTPPEGVIGRATADDPLGPWTVDAEPVLLRGNEGSWDSGHIGAPSVVRTEDGYVMYYEGADDNFVTAIGMATSDDGITWAKYDDPATADAPYAESDPVLVSDVADYRFHQPRVETTDGGYVMIFRLAPLPTGPRGQMGLAMATSTDGMAWDVITDAPFWERDTIPASNGFWFTATAYVDDTLYLYIEGGRGSGTDIYVATASGPFFEE